MPSRSMLLLAMGCACLVGCGQAKDGSPDTNSSAPNAAYLLNSEPAGAVGVGEGRKSTDEEVTIVGRIGGSAKPFVNGLAAFTIVDPKVPYCAPEEGCPTPWDYCCETNQLKDNSATITIVDDQGTPIAGDAKSLLGVKELSTVVVHGKAQRDNQGNLTVAARRVFVRQDQ